MQNDEAQLTPSSRASRVPGGTGTARLRQPRPSHDEVRGRSPAERAPKYWVGASCAPAATHADGEGHETDTRPLLPFGEGGEGGCATHASPEEVIASGTWTP